MTKKRWFWPTVLIVIMFGLPAFLAWNFVIGPMLSWKDQYTLLLGKPESEVIRILGPPKFVESAEQAKQKGIDFPWRNLQLVPEPEHQVHKKVLLYLQRGIGVYVFIGDDDRVEAIDFAGTG